MARGFGQKLSARLLHVEVILRVRAVSGDKEADTNLQQKFSEVHSLLKENKQHMVVGY